MAISRRAIIGSLGVAGLAWPASGRAQPSGVAEREILIGRVTPAESPLFSDMTKQRRTGADACIARVNAAGGVYGRKIRVIDRDDSYRPDKAAASVQELIEREGIFAMLGAFGQPTLPVVMSKVEAAGVPLVGAVTLSQDAHSPLKRYVFPVRISGLGETSHTVKHQRTLAVERFVVLSSNEAYGPAGAASFGAALKGAGVTPVDTVVFGAKDDPEIVAKRLNTRQPQTLLVSVLPKPFAAVLSHYRRLGGAAQAIGFSAIRIEDLRTALGPLAAGVALSQAVPVPTRAAVPLVMSYQAALSAHDPKAAPSYHGLDAYLEAMVLVEGLQRAGRSLSRERLVSGLESMTGHDFGGVMVRYGPQDRTGSTYVDIVMLAGHGRLVY